MARAPNFYYQNPTGDIGSALVRAIFGDPAAAAQQQQQRAEMDLSQARAEEARTHGGLYTSQADGQGIQNNASRSLPELMASLSPRAGLPDIPLNPDNPGDAGFDASFDRTFDPAAQPETPEAAMARGLPAVLAAMGQMNGDKIDPRQVIGTLASFSGGDEMARRGLVAQGQSPSKDFAITPERADQVAANGYEADQNQAFGVARINHSNDVAVAQANHATDIPVAKIRADGTVQVAGVREGGGTSRGERNNNPGNIEMGPFARRMGATSSDGRFAIFPTYEAGSKAQETLLNGPGYMGGGRNTIDAILTKYAPPSDGNSVNNYANYVSRATGIPRGAQLTPDQIPMVAQAMRQFETGSANPGGNPGKAPAAPKPPKPITPKQLTMIDETIDHYFQANNVKLPTTAYNEIRSRSIVAFQASGDPVGAVMSTIHSMGESNRARKAAAAPAPDLVRYSPGGRRGLSAATSTTKPAPQPQAAATPAHRPATIKRDPVRVGSLVQAMSLPRGTPYTTPDGEIFIR